MSRYCLDTVSYSHFKRGEQRITTLLDRHAADVGRPFSLHPTRWDDVAGFRTEHVMRLPRSTEAQITDVKIVG